MRERFSPCILLALLLAVLSCRDDRLVLQGQARPTGDAAGGSDAVNILPSTDAAAADAPWGHCEGDACEWGDVGAVCGNGIIEQDETCDDGNSRPGDGCSGLCRREPNYLCKVAGQPCVPGAECGDGHLGGSETCDDGNTDDGDGCSAQCQLEAGSGCGDGGADCGPPNPGKCGDGAINDGETCDDRNTDPGDGCSAQCQIEGGWMCPVPGEKCSKDEYCGDGKLSPARGELCDDGNSAPGDGCTGTCQMEPFYECPVPGQKCVSTIVCGDGKVVGDEACDDSNQADRDGCSADCKRVEPGYTCPRSGGIGGPCVPREEDRCGDKRLSYGETCDDGNSDPLDGCSNLCRVELGYRCPVVGQPCELVAVCGDGKIGRTDGEQCDDGNAKSGDGCSERCMVEANYVCPVEGQKCRSTVVCGDGKVSGGETCDDGNTWDYDGCGSGCTVEAGWTCPPNGVCRPTRCGDGLRVGSEQCDDKNSASGDGCSAACLLESPGPGEANGWICPVEGLGCIRTVCGNGIREGSEQCDDGNNDTADGCTPFCRKEPVCPAAGGACTTSCGDGMLLPADVAAGQACDDGNTVSGDGCSSACKIERGYACDTAQVVQDPLILPIILRDFKAYDETDGHPDFQQYNGSETGIVEDTLGSNGKPVHVAANKEKTTNTASWKTDGSTDYFGLWYRDSAYSKTVRDVLSFTKLSSGAYQFSSPDTDASDDGFYRLDNKGWGNYAPYENGLHNYHFTSEVRYWFEYEGGERLDFTGDDDVWVFINKKLAVDLGGVHGAKDGSVILHASDGTGAVCDLVTTDCANRRTVQLNLVKGSVYEIVVFQAERHTTKSSYTLTLSNFSATRSSCHSVCGDGVVTPDEACDLGTANNTGAYGTCNPDCTLAPSCGDKVVQPAREECDDGVNLAAYGGTSRACGPGCLWAPYCGDAKADTGFGELCDQGADNGRGYGFCSATCGLGPRCGDGAVTDGEECDHGSQNGMPGDTCSGTCTWRCGDGTLDDGEQCDDGKNANTGGYGKCNPDCTLGPRCGDGIKNGNEGCDDGVNDGAYGMCAPGCVLGPRCGDGTVQPAAGELCDLGAANLAGAYGRDRCTTRCRPAPFCGDRAVDAAFGEKCDDGVNSGAPGSCAPDCSASIPLSSCGNGTIQPPEQCDDGTSNGSPSSACDSNCRWKCGNGYPDPGEECDDGVNDGSYGTCRPTCKLADYCGDGVRNGNEACDLGVANQPNPYGAGLCTTACTIAPYCGDRRIQSAFGEECDGALLCTPECKKKIIQ